MKLYTPFILFSLTASNPSFGDSTLRCGNHLAYQGDAIAKVQSICGKPAQTTSSTVSKPNTTWHNGRPYFFGETIVQVETLIYNFGPRQFMRQLRFEDGVLIQIDTLSYGYNEPQVE